MPRLSISRPVPVLKLATRLKLSLSTPDGSPASQLLFWFWSTQPLIDSLPDLLDLGSPIGPGMDYPLTAELVGADQPTGDPINTWALRHWKELTLHMDLTWFGRGERGGDREAPHSDTETRCRSPDAYDAATPHALNP